MLCLRITEEELDFISKNWQDMTDKEMAESLNIERRKVEYYRRARGLKKKRGRPPGKSSGKMPRGLMSKISRESLWQALNRGGKTKSDVASEVGLSRERVRQVCEDWNIVVKITPEWWARRCGQPKLADRAWLEAELKRAGGVTRLSRELNISPAKISSQAKRLRIDYSLVVFHAEMVEITCEFCGKKKQRKQSEIKRNKYTFCSRRCKGKWLALNFGRPNLIKRTPPWSQEKDDFIITHYREMTDNEISKSIDKTRSAVTQRRSGKLGLKKGIYYGRRWSTKEKTFLRANYLKMTDNQLAKKLDRTWGSIYQARHKWGLKRGLV